MMKELDHLEIPVEVEGGNVITLYIDPQNKNKAKLYELESPSAGEYRYQLMEGCTYQYEFVGKEDEVYQFQKRMKSSRSIDPGIAIPTWEPLPLVSMWGS